MAVRSACRCGNAAPNGVTDFSPLFNQRPRFTLLYFTLLYSIKSMLCIYCDGRSLAQIQMYYLVVL